MARQGLRRVAVWQLWAWPVLAVVLLAGCTRARYYRAADEEAKCLIFEKSNDPRWAMPPDYTVTMDPRSRYHDPCNPVCPPMPKDDPASHQYMVCVDGKRGWPHWDEFGCRRYLENAGWAKALSEYAPMTEQGEVKLSLESALAIARINSPSYQDQLETLYLSSLDVSTERFRFDVQFFGGNDVAFEHLGALRRGADANTLTNDIGFQARRRFATAGELLVGFANSMVWQFAGPDSSANVSLLNFNLVQPLLRGAGRDVALEQLTIAERALLSNLRAMERYRQGFYTRVAIGDAGVTGPQRRGGFFGGTGLTGFTGTGAGGFGGVGASEFRGAGFGAGGAAGSGAGTAGFAGGGAGQVGGFIGLLQQLQQIRNTQESLALQLRTLGLLESHLEAGTIDLTQVDQFRQNIETERANLLQARNSLEDAMDNYNTGILGMPPHLPIDLDDTLIRQFQLIAPDVSLLQNELNDFLAAFGDLPMNPDEEAVRKAIDRLAALRTEAAKRFAEVAEDLKRLETVAGEREATLEPADRRRFEADVKRLLATFAELRTRFEQTEAMLEKVRVGLGPNTRRATADALVQLVTLLSQTVDQLSLVQARARLEAVGVEHEAVEWQDALDIARANRLDWMNNRAALVDTWRLIQFNADALQSNLSVTFSGDMSTTGDNPVRFRAPTGRLFVGMQFDAPFTRLLERNTFRAVLIDYQRDRRRLIQYEDSVELTLRGLARQLEQLRINLEIQRRAVIIAIRRVDQTRDVLNQPPPPAQPGQATTQLGPTAALNLLTALNDLRSSQNNFMSVWLNYQATRMRLSREMGVMRFDPNGLWVDQPLDAQPRLRPEEVPLPPAVPEEWLRELDQTIEKPEPMPEPDNAPLPPTAPPVAPAATEARRPSSEGKGTKGS